MDRQLKIGATYRHWKAGSLYEVLGEIEIKNNFRHGMALRLVPYGFVVASTPLEEGDIGVIYKNKSGNKFAREKNNFLEVLGDEQEGTKYYRFEECNT